jgi:sugar lactone lactonase YvrE
LREVETRLADRVVVIGVHSAKFPQERGTDAVAQAVRRHQVLHPVVNDANFAVWQAYACRAWPTLMFIDPQGKVIGRHEGEFESGQLLPVLGRMLDEFDAKGWIVPGTPHFGPAGAAAQTVPGNGLAFPGKVLIDERGRGHVTIADSNRNRLVVLGLSTFGGAVHHVVGDGLAGLADGAPEAARFRWPQGMALDPRTGVVYIADTGNHCVRRMSPDGGTITTIAGTGKQARTRSTGGQGTAVALSSPWDLAFLPDPKASPLPNRGPHEDPYDDRGLLFIAMAGTHQIWVLDLESGRVAPWAGSGSEALADGPCAEAAFAQPQGLAIDPHTNRLWVADSETSAIREIDLARGTVSTLVGHGLFDFGDLDGTSETARLQHPMGVAFWADDPAGASLLVADTYNHRVKRIDLDRGVTMAWSGAGAPDGLADGDPQTARFSEPTGIAVGGGYVLIADTNNHRIRAIAMRPDGTAGDVVTVPIDFGSRAH